MMHLPCFAHHSRHRTILRAAGLAQDAFGKDAVVKVRRMEHLLPLGSVRYWPGKQPPPRPPVLPWDSTSKAPGWEGDYMSEEEDDDEAGDGGDAVQLRLALAESARDAEARRRDEEDEELQLAIAASLVGA